MPEGMSYENTGGGRAPPFFRKKSMHEFDGLRVSDGLTGGESLLSYQIYRIESDDT